MMTEEKKGTRRHEHVLEIGATPEAVWSAITTPEGIASWFPPQARVEPGVGGRITYEWAPDMVGLCRIQAWEPEKHLRMTWADTVEGREDALIVDWTIEGKGGVTVLRLVHSGFGPNDSWDGDFEGTRRGWMFELGSLKHYLESHAGEQAISFWVRQATELDPLAVWNRFSSPGSFIQEGRLDGLAVGDPYRITLADGQILEGVVRMNIVPLQWVGTVKRYADGLLRIAIDNCGGGAEANIMVKTWGRPASEVESLRERYGRLLSRTFG